MSTYINWFQEIYNSKIQKNMSNISMQNLQTKFVALKNKLSKLHTNKTSSLTPLTKLLPQRNCVIHWIYHAQKALSFSRSSLFLGIALLDKLLICGLTLTDSNCQLIGGTLTLLITKFNEVYPVTVRKLQGLSTNCISLERYVQTQSIILHSLGFDLSPESRVYQHLAELQSKLGEDSEEIIKTAVVNPAIAFKLGEAALVTAIESMHNGGLTERTNETRLSWETSELRSELLRLNSHCPNTRIVSPQRA